MRHAWQCQVDRAGEAAASVLVGQGVLYSRGHPDLQQRSVRSAVLSHLHVTLLPTGTCSQSNPNHSTTTSSLPCSLLASQVRVQAGARVQAVADELRGHGLTLQNYASIREQTVGGFIQVSSAAC
jgi:hypothetical protein